MGPADLDDSGLGRPSATRTSEQDLELGDRRRRVIQGAINAIYTARDPSEVLAHLFEAWSDIAADEIDLCVYAIAESGTITRVRSNGRFQLNLPETVDPYDGHIGNSIAQRRSIYEPNLPVEDGFNFHDESPDKVARTSFTLFMRWHADRRPAAIQAVSATVDAFSSEDRKAMETIAQVAETAAIGLQREAVWNTPSRQLTDSKSTAVLLDLLQPLPVNTDLLRRLKSLYEGLTEEALQRGQAATASIRLEDPKTGTLRFAVWKGDQWTPGAENRIYKRDENSAGNVALRNGTFIYHRNVDAHDCNYFVRVHEKTKSLFVVPFRVGRRARAIVTLTWNVTDGAPEDVRHEVRRLVDHYETVFALLETRLEMFVQDLQQELARSKDVAQTVRLLLSRVQSMFEARSAQFFEWRPEHDSLTMVASTLPALQNYHQKRECRIGENLTGWVANEKKPLRLESWDQPNETGRIDPPIRPNRKVEWMRLLRFHDSPGHQAYLGVPLLSGDKCLGVLELNRSVAEGRFSNFDEAILVDIADRLAEALRPAFPPPTPTEQPSASYIAQTAAELCQSLLEEFMRAARAQAGLLQVRPKRGPAISSAWPARPQSVTFDLSGIKGTRYASTLQEDHELAATLRGIASVDDSTLDSAVVIPLPFKSRSFSGHLALLWAGRQTFDEDQKVSIDIFGKRAAYQIERALSLQQKIADLEDLRTLGLELALKTDRKDLMDTVLKWSVEASGMTKGTIRSFDPIEEEWVLETSRDASEAEIPRLMAQNEVTRPTVEGRKPRFVRDTYADEGWTALRQRERDPQRLEYLNTVRTSLYVPIFLGGDCLGMIFLDSQEITDVPADTLAYLEDLSHYVAVAIYITRIQENAEPLALLGAIMSGFLHVMRNQLQNIVSAVAVVADPACTPELRDRWSPDLNQHVRRLQTTINDLGRFASQDHLKLVEPIDLKGLLDKVVYEFRERPRLQIEVDVPELTPRLPGHPYLLEDAFRMLVQNAVEAMPGGGTLRIEANSAANELSLTFKDTGHGMDEKTCTRCMLPFFSTKSGSNTGLGLAVVHGVVHKHRGKIRVESEVGRGTAFTLTFPLNGEKKNDNGLAG